MGPWKNNWKIVSIDLLFFEFFGLKGEKKKSKNLKEIQKHIISYDHINSSQTKIGAQDRDTLIWLSADSLKPVMSKTFTQVPIYLPYFFVAEGFNKRKRKNQAPYEITCQQDD